MTSCQWLQTHVAAVLYCIVLYCSVLWPGHSGFVAFAAAAPLVCVNVHELCALCLLYHYWRVYIVVTVSVVRYDARSAPHAITWHLFGNALTVLTCTFVGHLEALQLQP